MQGQKISNKKRIILNALAATVKELRGDKSQFILGCENDISTSIFSTIERGLKDPQLTTIFKLSEAFDISPVEFVRHVCNKLPDGFEIIDK